MQGGSQPYDSSINVQIAGTIVMALLAVYVLHKLNFRFVVGVGA